MKYQRIISLMKYDILNNLSDLPDYHGRRKKIISESTGIPMDILTVLLKQLKIEGKVRLVMIWCEYESTPNGSGYALSDEYKQQTT